MSVTDFTALYDAEIVGVALEERVPAHARAGEDRCLISIWLRLGHGDDVTIHGAGVGSGVMVRTQPPEPIDLTTYGHLEVVDADGRHGLSPGRVTKVWEVWSAGDSVGVRWQLADGVESVACFSGDEWHIGGTEAVGNALAAAGPLTYTALYDAAA